MADNELNPLHSEESPATIRVIEDGKSSGAWNMAVDESLLASAAQQRTATLRWYGWNEPTLSLGYFQRHADRCSHSPSTQCPLVRRHSGGGAIVHDRELTYSLTWPATPRSDDLATRLYTAVHQSLIETLADFGIVAQSYTGAQDSKENESFLCFLRRAVGDVCLSSDKLMGSAQRRRRQAILQHGSLLWARSPAAPELPGLFDLFDQQAHAHALGDEWAPLLGNWQRRLFAGLAVVPEQGGLTGEENSRAQSLMRNKFSKDAWNLRR